MGTGGNGNSTLVNPIVMGMSQKVENGMGWELNKWKWEGKGNVNVESHPPTSVVHREWPTIKLLADAVLYVIGKLRRRNSFVCCSALLSSRTATTRRWKKMSVRVWRITSSSIASRTMILKCRWLKTSTGLVDYRLCVLCPLNWRTVYICFFYTVLNLCFV